MAEEKTLTVKTIWITFGILAAITALEFLIAFTVPKGQLKLWTFVIMTIVKAYYIGGQFMHLNYERKGLIWSLVLPMVILVGWMLLLIGYEGIAFPHH